MKSVMRGDEAEQSKGVRTHQNHAITMREITQNLLNW